MKFPQRCFWCGVSGSVELDGVFADHGCAATQFLPIFASKCAAGCNAQGNVAVGIWDICGTRLQTVA